MFSSISSIFNIVNVQHLLNLSKTNRPGKKCPQQWGVHKGEVSTGRGSTVISELWKKKEVSSLSKYTVGSAVESILLLSKWTLTEKPTKQLLYQIGQNCIRCQMGPVPHKIRAAAIGNLSKLSDRVRRRKLMFADHSRRSEYEMVSRLVLWTPRQGQCFCPPRKLCTEILPRPPHGIMSHGVMSWT